MFNPLNDLVSLFYPPVCPTCGGEMPEGAVTICTQCRWEAPLTGYWMQADNPVVRKFWGIVPVVNACSFFFFVPGGGFRSLVHDIKYRGGWRQAIRMGEWFGAEMAEGGLYGDVDVIVPVPLHIRKRLSRGYNQSEYIAEGMARSLDCRVDRRSVVRVRHNPSQALKSHRDRWDNVEGIFAIRGSVSSPYKFSSQLSDAAQSPKSSALSNSAPSTKSSPLSGKHILLVDDVLTTGATITSCAEAILAAVPDCRISIATLSVSKSDLEIA